MRAYCIALDQDGVEAVRASHDDVGNEFLLVRWEATRPEHADSIMRDLGLVWTWPWDEPDVCPASGLKRHPYATRDRSARVACFLSHWRLWRRCAETREACVVLEDDAVFVHRLEPDAIPKGWGAVGLNDPRGATRRADRFHRALVEATDAVVPVPWVDDDRAVPQGLAGASAYLIEPWMARRLIEHSRTYGAWPNDALLCKQLCPEIGVTKRTYTKVSGRMSTLA